MAPKAKAQKMSLGDFLGDQALGSWADEMEDSMPVPSDSRTGYGGGERRTFSSAGAGGFGGDRSLDRFADRGFARREELPLPSKPPYTAHLGNLSYDVTNGDVEDFFAECEVTNIRIVEDKMEHKPKGFGYCEFRSLEGLKKALALDGAQFQGRNIRISVAEPSKERAETRVLDDWTRKGPLPDLPGQQQRRTSERGGFGMERGGSRRGEYESAPGGGARDLGSWERKGPLSPIPGQEPQRGAGRGRGDGPPRERNLSPQWGEGTRDGSRPPRGEFRERPPPVERQPTAAEMDNQWRARMKPDAPTPSADATPDPSTPSSPAQPPAPAGRPRLNLQKRTVSEAVNTDQASSDPSKPNPFGAARPIDTATREREVEEKRQLAIRQKKEADDKAREEKKEKEAAAKAAAAEQAKSPTGEEANGEDEEEAAGENSAAPARASYQILSRGDDEDNSVASSVTAQDEPANGEIVEDKAVKPREFTRPPPRGPKAQSGTWRRKSSTPGKADAAAGGPTAAALEDDGWSTVPAKSGRGGRGRGGQRALAS